MRFYAQRDEVTEAASLVGKAVSEKVLKDIMKNILVEADEARQVVKLRGTNGIMEISATFGAKVEEGGSFCFDPIAFATIARYGAEKPIRFSVAKRLAISQGKQRRMQTGVIPGNEFPEEQSFDDWGTVDAQRLGSVVQRCALASSITADKPWLQSVFFNPDQAYAVGGDGNRVVMMSLDIQGQYSTSQPPGKLIDTVIPFLKGVEEVEMHVGNWLAIRTETFQIAINSVAGEYSPALRSAVVDTLNSKPAVKIKMSRTSLINALEVIDIYTQRAQRSGTNFYSIFSLKDGKAHLSIEVKGVGKAKEPIEIEELEGDENLDLKFLPTSLLSILRVVPASVIEMRLFGGLSPFLVLDPDDGDFAYLQVPMRTTSGERAPRPDAVPKGGTETEQPSSEPEDDFDF